MVDDYISIGAILGTIAYIFAKRVYLSHWSEVVAQSLSSICFGLLFGMCGVRAVCYFSGITRDNDLVMAVGGGMALAASWIMDTAAPGIGARLLDGVRSFNLRAWIAKMLNLVDKKDGE